MKVKFIAVVVLITFILSSCENSENGLESNISQHNLSKSHNMGVDCMNCHISGGEGSGWFNVAGTIYQSNKTSTFANATVQLFSQAGGGGVLVATVEADAKGNFYTTDGINFGTGLFPAVEGTSGTHFMGSAITSGRCNSCHGVTTDHIWTE